jgi:hypothetical protein
VVAALKRLRHPPIPSAFVDLPKQTTNRNASACCLVLPTPEKRILGNRLFACRASVREPDSPGLGSDVVAISSEVSLLTTLPEGAILGGVPTFRKADLSNDRGYGLVSVYLKKGSRKPSEEIPT